MKLAKRIIVLLALVLTAQAAQAQKEQPKAKMHRVHDTTRAKGSAWYFARSTGGHFSVLLPLPFNDFSMTMKDTLKKDITVHMAGCKSDDNFQFSVMETPLGTRKVDLKDHVKGFTTLELKEEKKPGYESISFKLSGGGRYGWMKYVKTGKYLFMMSAECLYKDRASLDKVYPIFFESLKVY